MLILLWSPEIPAVAKYFHSKTAQSGNCECDFLNMTESIEVCVFIIVKVILTNISVGTGRGT